MPVCIVCDGRADHVVERHRGYVILRCASCGLQFSDPMQGATAHYAQAYDQGGGPAEVAGEGLPFLGWTEQARAGLPEYASFLTAAQQFALSWSRGRSHGGSRTALEFGFGAGWFLGALQAAGFDARGLEVADAPVAVLRAKGFCVGRSASEWPAFRPTLIACFEVLEHLEDPVGFLASLRHDFPAADVVLSVPDERRWFLLGGREAHDYPPNHLTRWSPLALRRALERAGFAYVGIWRLREISMARWRRFLPFQRDDGAGEGIQRNGISTTLPQEMRKRQRRRRLAVPLALVLSALGRTACSMVGCASGRAPVEGDSGR